MRVNVDGRCIVTDRVTLRYRTDYRGHVLLLCWIRHPYDGTFRFISPSDGERVVSSYHISKRRYPRGRPV